MLNISFGQQLATTPILIIFISSFFSMLINYLNHVKNTIFTKKKTKKKSLSNKETNFITLSNFNSLFIITIILFLNFKSNINLKNFVNFNDSSLNLFLFFFLFFLYCITNYLFDSIIMLPKKTLNYNQYINLFFVLITFVIFFINNYFLLFFFIELLGYIFYFQFLQIFNKLKTKDKKNFYLDSLLMFYWVNFFGSVILAYSLIFLFFSFNTTKYNEITYFVNYTARVSTFYCFFIVGLSVKLGVAGFHFLKIEVYKNLKIDSIINFSFLSIFGYLIIIKIFIIKTAIIINFVYFLVFINIFFIFFLFQNVNLKNIMLFFGYSAILNVSLLLFLLT